MKEYIQINQTLQNIPSYECSSNLKGICLKVQGIKYLITLNHGLPIKSIQAEGTSINNYTNCNWNELVFSQNFNNLPNQYVFKQIVKKQIDSSIKYYTNGTDTLKYIGNSYLNINMLPNNPRNIYYMMKCITAKVTEGCSGKPIFNHDKKLVGIISKIEGDIVYVIPSIYILKSLEREDNGNIYTLPLTNIKKINKCFVKNNMVYHASLKVYIPLDVYLTLEGDKNKVINVTSIATKNRNFVLLNTPIKNDTGLVINNNDIKITSSFIHYLKIIENIGLIIQIFNNISTKRKFRYEINDKLYYLSF